MFKMRGEIRVCLNVKRRQSFKGKMVSIQSWRKDKTKKYPRKAEGMGSKSRLVGRLQAEGGIASFV